MVMDNQENIKQATEWGCLTSGTYKLTEAQQSRRRRGKSIWERDKVVHPYEVSKGKYV